MSSLSENHRFLLTNISLYIKLCVDKCTKYETQAKDEVLKSLFTTIKQCQQKKFDCVQQILNCSSESACSIKDECNAESYKPQATYTANSNATDKENDKYLCTDVILTLKYISIEADINMYQFGDTCIRKAFCNILCSNQCDAEKLWIYKTVNQMTN